MKKSVYTAILAILLTSFSLSAFAEEINDFTGPASCPTTTNYAIGNVPVAIGMEVKTVAFGNEYINDEGYIAFLGCRVQEGLYNELNTFPNGSLKPIPLDAQSLWARAGELAKMKNPNRDSSKVIYNGGKTPQYIVEIIKYTTGNAENEYSISDLANLVMSNYYNNIPLDADLANQFTVVRLEARIYDLRAKENLSGSNGSMIVARGKGEANNTQVNISILSSSRNKDTNYVLAEEAAIRNLAADIQKQVKGLPLHQR